MPASCACALPECAAPSGNAPFYCTQLVCKAQRLLESGRRIQQPQALAHVERAEPRIGTVLTDGRDGARPKTDAPEMQAMLAMVNAWKVLNLACSSATVSNGLLGPGRPPGSL